MKSGMALFNELSADDRIALNQLHEEEQKNAEKEGRDPMTKLQLIRELTPEEML